MLLSRGGTLVLVGCSTRCAAACDTAVLRRCLNVSPLSAAARAERRSSHALASTSGCSPALGACSGYTHGGCGCSGQTQAARQCGRQLTTPSVSFAIPTSSRSVACAAQGVGDREAVTFDEEVRSLQTMTDPAPVPVLFLDAV